jgi:predicted thioesterase
MGWTTGVRFPAEAMMKVFLLATAFIPSLETTQPPIQCVREALSSRDKAVGHEADLSHLVSRLRKHGAIPPLI